MGLTIPLRPSSTLASRRLVGELMDDPALDPGLHRSALHQLARLNALAAGHRILWPALRALATGPGHPALRILDIATGSGDIPVRLTRLARRANLTFQIDGCDTSALALTEARARAAGADLDLHFFPLDAVADPLLGGYDVVMCSLFMHHLTDEDAAHLLYKMRCAAGRAVLVSDLVRSRAGLALAWTASHVFSRSHVVHVDAVRSVEAAFTPDEFGTLAAAAGMRGASITRAHPCRFLLHWTRS